MAVTPANKIVRGGDLTAIGAAIKSAIAGKQDTISDLAHIRSGASAGATAYQKPSTGIPASDLASGVLPDTSTFEVESNKVTSLSSSSTDTQYPSAKCVYDTIHPAVETEQGNGMEPNKLYRLGTLTSAVTFTLGTPSYPDIVNHYYWTFETGSTAPTITWPASITKWNGGSAPTIAANKHYEVSVLDGVAAIMEA